MFWYERFLQVISPSASCTSPSLSRRPRKVETSSCTSPTWTQRWVNFFTWVKLPGERTYDAVGVTHGCSASRVVPSTATQAAWLIPWRSAWRATPHPSLRRICEGWSNWSVVHFHFLHVSLVFIGIFCSIWDLSAASVISWTSSSSVEKS